MKLYLLLIFGMLFLAGCINPPNPPDLGNQTINYTNLKTDETLELEFLCEYGVNHEVNFSNLVFWTCSRNTFGGFSSGFYTIGGHPGKDMVVTYIIYDGKKYSEIKTKSELEKYFIPIESPNEAIIYVYLHEGLNIRMSIEEAPLAGITNAKEIEGGYEVTILHADWIMCPCYGVYWKTGYQVLYDGTIKEISDETILTFQHDCIC
ncbi:MAG: hypothetical protein WC501_05165 [Candidatus Micrarchaeia archaeon]